MKRTFFWVTAAVLSFVAAQCSSNTQKDKVSSTPDSIVVRTKTDTVVFFLGMNTKGFGRFKNVRLAHPPDEAMAIKGKAIFQTKCFACHKLTTELLVGPGWAGVTERRTPEWIMNWITNTKVMLDRDLAAQTELVTCLIRMPNQDLSDVQARNILEFMRKNDGDK